MLDSGHSLLGILGDILDFTKASARRPAAPASYFPPAPIFAPPCPAFAAGGPACRPAVHCAIAAAQQLPGKALSCSGAPCGVGAPPPCQPCLRGCCCGLSTLPPASLLPLPPPPSLLFLQLDQRTMLLESAPVCLRATVEASIEQARCACCACCALGPHGHGRLTRGPPAASGSAFLEEHVQSRLRLASLP